MFYNGLSDKMKYFITFVALSFMAINAQSFSQSAQAGSETVVAEIGNYKITAPELERAFKKNMSRTTDNLFKMSKDSIEDFLDLYITFRLKVMDAIERGFLKDSSVLAEIEQNRRILAESFYYDKMLTEKNVNRFLDMRKKEYQVAVILANIKQNADMIDTTEAYSKIMSSLYRVKDGEDFAEIAKTLSDDYETGKNGGVIPNYITSGKVQRPIEEAIYSTKPGQVYPKPVKTQYGYFLIKVLDESKRELVKARHILIAVNEDRDSAQAHNKADSILKLLKSGSDFASLAKTNSDDLTTAVNGGDMGGFYSRATGMEGTNFPLVNEFEETLFNLKNGEMSDIVHTSFGAHIILRETSKSPDFNKESEDLRKIYKRLYFKYDQKELLDSLKKVYKFKLYEDVLFQFTSFLDTNATNLADNWDADVADRVKNNVIYEINGKQVKVSELIKIMNEDVKLRGANLNPSGIVALINSLAESVAFDEATKNLEVDYPDFDALMSEFRDGILLFKVEAMEVWDKMKFDSALARTYYDSTKSKYITDDAYDVSEIYFMDKNTADSVYNRIVAGEDFDIIAANETQRSGFREKKGHWGHVNVKTNSLARRAKDTGAKKGQILEPFKNEPGYSIVKVNDYFPPRPKTFEEAIPDFSPQYQEILQSKLSKQWIDSIKKKFPIKIHEKELNKLISEKK
jgi:peptidyl-prolyl cis-trans isomerase SurA